MAMISRYTKLTFELRFRSTYQRANSFRTNSLFRKTFCVFVSVRTMAGEHSELEKTFSFSLLPTKFPFQKDKDILAYFMKWSILGRISAQSYSFDNNFHPYSCEKFALCFFRDPKVVSSLRNSETKIWIPLDKPVVSVSVELVPCTQVSMELFDPIYSCGILWPCGHVVKCRHDVIPDYDKLREMLHDEESEHYYAVGKARREEFLFRLFKHLRLGGELCQYEDAIDPYINTTKRMYKDLISVQKDPDTKKISVVSTVLKVCAYDESGRCFPGIQEAEQTFAYLIIDPLKHQVTLFFHVHGVGDFNM